MAGNRAGGLRSAETNKRLYGEDFYKKIGKAGGEKSQGGGFAANREIARLAGRVGGMTSRKNSIPITAVEIEEIKQAKLALDKLKGSNK